MGCFYSRDCFNEGLLDKKASYNTSTGSIKRSYSYKKSRKSSKKKFLPVKATIARTHIPILEPLVDNPLYKKRLIKYHKLHHRSHYEEKCFICKDSRRNKLETEDRGISFEEISFEEKN